ncbi:hypothetical protein, partial [Bradyrhizobium jicamae]|uniref:hypothetical protein n=1 Tax=Bradyrhizobium jicamae TaxID=280332 RepID=UPI001BADB6E3
PRFIIYRGTATIMTTCSEQGPLRHLVQRLRKLCASQCSYRCAFHFLKSFAQGAYMDCTAILAEVQANNEKVKQLAADKGLTTAQNVAAGVAGFVIPV